MGAPEAAARKWERDKAELVELGVPLAFVPDPEGGPGGYAVDRAAYYLKDLSLAPEELALLSVAGAAALAQPSFPFRTDLAHALDKLAFARGDGRRPGDDGARFVMHLPAPGVEARAEVLDALGRAVASRKDVDLAYRSFTGEVTERRVSPYGLAYRRGAWFLVGHCHLRNGIRTFQAARILDLRPHEQRPRTPDFEVPAGFSVEAHVAVEPWQYGVHAPVIADLRLDPEVALLARPKFGNGATVTPTEGGAVRVEVTTTNGDALVREVLGLSPLAELAGPPRLRERAAAAAARIALAHEGPPEAPPWPEATPEAGTPAEGPAAPARRRAPKEDDLRERLRRALFLVPYAVAHPGIPVEELARAARLGVEELVEELDFLRLVGRPPFTPADYVDILVEDGRVHLGLPQGLLRPPTLTPLEAAALDAAASALSAEGGEALGRVREKLRAAVPPAAREEFDAVAGRVVVEAGSVPPATAALIDRAIRERRELELTYFAAGRGTSTRRTVRPLERVLHQGYWYLHAYCCQRRARRLFRLDRAADLVLTDRTFVPRPADDRARFHAPSLAPASGRQARVRIAPGPWAEPGQVRRLGALEVRGHAASGAEATFAVEGEAYLVSLILSLAGEAEVLAPADLRERVRETAAAAARRHGFHFGTVR